MPETIIQSEGHQIMKIQLCKLVLLAPLAGLIASGCDVYVRPPAAQVAVSVPGEVVVDTAPPPVPVEVMTVSPGPDFVWIGGAWFWAGGRWQWERGHWDHPPRPGAVWVAHHYEFRNGRHVFVRGGWR
jgi:hypothetical protein